MNIPLRYAAAPAVVACVLTFVAADHFHARDIKAKTHAADSSAAVSRALAHQAEERESHERAVRLREQARGDSLAKIATTFRHVAYKDMSGYDSVRAFVVIDSLPANAQEVVLAADRLRVSAVAALHADTAVIASRDSVIAIQTREIGDYQSALANMRAVDSTQRGEIALLKSAQAPRCGVKCGAFIGVGAVLVVSHGDVVMSIARSVLSLVRRR